jgi:hypothetical protein
MRVALGEGGPASAQIPLLHPLQNRGQDITMRDTTRRAVRHLATRREPPPTSASPAPAVSAASPLNGETAAPGSQPLSAVAPPVLHILRASPGCNRNRLTVPGVAVVRQSPHSARADLPPALSQLLPADLLSRRPTRRSPDHPLDLSPS